jgi:acyl carrier protein
MTPQEVERKAKTIIAEKLAIAEHKVTPQANFVDDLGAGCLEQVELCMAFEDEFDIYSWCFRCFEV